LKNIVYLYFLSFQKLGVLSLDAEKEIKGEAKKKRYKKLFL